MAKTRKFYYAVKKGRDGPKVYDSWEECRMTVTRFPRAEFKKFRSLADAEAWILPALMSPASTVPGNFIPDGLTSIHPLVEQSTQESTQPISVEPAPLNVATSHGEDILGVDTTEDEDARMDLTEEQNNVLEKVKNGDNVFFTGSAGTGKTVLLRKILRYLRSTGRRVAVTASTGIASVSIGGTTLHSWAGIGLGEAPAHRLSGKILGTERLRKRWWDVDSLIIDEISMISGGLFDKLEEIAQTVRSIPDPFGGIQLIVTGDFCQLPPVPNRHRGVAIPSTFAFDAESWSRCIDTPMILKRVFRQQDQAFVDMLNSMRWGQISKEDIPKFHQLSRGVVHEDGIGPTELYPTRSEVEKANNTRLAQIIENPVSFYADDRPGLDEEGNPRVSFQEMERLLDRLVALPTVVLKTGAQVMLIKNLEQGRLVNGSTGRVIGFGKHQGAALRDSESHSRSHVRGDDKPEAKGLDCVEQSDTQWPLVRFTNGCERLCAPEEFTVNDAFGNVEASRTQVPLILAWALSVHKSQGQTLERVRVDLRNTFEKGQAYVALSRAKTLEKLEVLNFDPLKVMAHPRVIEWYKGRIDDQLAKKR